jgi:Flp pilus assembly pilin Flp
MQIQFSRFFAESKARLNRCWKETAGQDFIEYALLTGFVAVTAGAIMPDVVTNISTIFSKVKSIMAAAQTVGS